MRFWKIRVFFSRWRIRFRYLLSAHSIYKNWWAMFLPKLGVSVVLQLQNGSRYLVRSGSTDLAVVNEAAILNPYLGSGHFKLSEDAVVIDVGANIGDFTVQVARMCSRGRVIAVEPVSECARMLAVQLLLNQIENVTCIQAALGSQDDEVEIHVDGTMSSAYWGKGKAEKVRRTTLPHLMQKLKIDRVNLLKLDCEGAEWDILPASEDVLPRIDQICLEFHCAGDWTVGKLASWLRARGYEVRHTAEAWNGMLWAWRTSPETGSAEEARISIADHRGDS